MSNKFEAEFPSSLTGKVSILKESKVNKTPNTLLPVAFDAAARAGKWFLNAYQALEMYI